MIAKKFNPDTNSYDEWIIDNDCVPTPKYADLEIPCAGCRRMIKANESYASTQILNATNDDLSYLICKECHEKELML